MPEITEAIQLKNYYSVAALILTLVIQIVRKAPRVRDLWAKIPTGWRWLVPVLGGAATGFVDAFNGGQAPGAAALSALFGALGIGSISMGLNAALTESPIPWNGGKGGAQKNKRERDTLPPPPRLPTFPPLAAAVLSLLPVSCGGSTPPAVPTGTIQTLAPLVCKTALIQDRRFDGEQVARVCQDSALAAKLTEDLTRIVLKAADEALQPKVDIAPGGPGSGEGGAGGRMP